jgi:hypothetical protein
MAIVFCKKRLLAVLDITKIKTKSGAAGAERGLCWCATIWGWGDTLCLTQVFYIPFWAGSQRSPNRATGAGRRHHPPHTLSCRTIQSCFILLTINAFANFSCSFPMKRTKNHGFTGFLTLRRIEKT